MSVNKDIILTQAPVEIYEGPLMGMNEKLYKLAEYLSMGLPTGQIANKLETTDTWVRAKRKEPNVISLVKELQSEALQTAKLCIQNTTVKAAQKIEKLIDNEDPKIALSAAVNTLDRVGLKAAEKREELITINYAHMSNDEIRESIETRLRALRGEED